MTKEQLMNVLKIVKDEDDMEIERLVQLLIKIRDLKRIMDDVSVSININDVINMLVSKQ